MTTPKVLPVVALLLAGLLSACSSGPSVGTLADAVEATTAAAALGVRVDGTVAMGGQVGPGSFTATGTVLPDRGVRSLAVDARPTGADPFAVDVVADGAATFQRGIPGFDDEAWVLVEGAPSAITADLPTFVDPLALLSMVDGLEGSVTDRGEEVVAGTPTQRIGVVLPSARLTRLVLDQVDALGADLAAQVLDRDEVSASAQAEVWVDGEGLVRQMRVAIRAGLPGGRVVPGIGVVDGELLLRIDPLEQAPEVTVPPEGTLVRTDFPALFRTEGS